MRTNKENFRPSQIPTLYSDAKLVEQAERMSLDLYPLAGFKRQKKLECKDEYGGKVYRMTYIPETLEGRVSFEKLKVNLCIFEHRSLSRTEICRHVQSILGNSEQSCRKPT